MTDPLNRSERLLFAIFDFHERHISIRQQQRNYFRKAYCCCLNSENKALDFLQSSEVLLNWHQSSVPKEMILLNSFWIHSLEGQLYEETLMF